MTTARRPAGWAAAAVLALALAGCGSHGGGTAAAPPTGHASSGASAGGKSQETPHRTRSGHGTHHATEPAPSRSTQGAGPTPTAHATASTRPSQGSEPSGSTGPTVGLGSTTGPGVEVLPETPGASPGGLPGLPHPHHARPPLVTAPLPHLATARGRLVRGYPARVLPRAPHSSVLVSSVAPSGNRLQVSLTGRTSLRPARLALFYRSRLARLGLRPESTPTVPGTTALGFGRGDSHVTLTVQPGRVTRYTLFATLSTTS